MPLNELLFLLIILPSKKCKTLAIIVDSVEQGCKYVGHVFKCPR